MTVTIVAHYPKSDQACVGDYTDIEILVCGGNLYSVQTYGDYYHDKGAAKAIGFVDALRLVVGNNIKVEHRTVADREEV